MNLADEEIPRRESDPNGTSAGANNDALGALDSDQANWMPLPEHGSGNDMHQTLQSLAIGRSALSQTAYAINNINNTGYVTADNGNGVDAGLSPDTAHSTGSNRPTPNSTTPSEPRSNRQANSDPTSYETSPAASSQRRLPPHTNGNGRLMDAFFDTQPDYSNTNPLGLSPDPFGMPETPGRDFSLPNGWDMSQQTTGLTPVGEGVFRQLMGLGPMDPMDLGWEGGS